MQPGWVGNEEEKGEMKKHISQKYYINELQELFKR